MVAVTASATQEPRDACLRAGMDAYLAKPVRIGDLRTAMAEAAALRAPTG